MKRQRTVKDTSHNKGNQRNIICKKKRKITKIIHNQQNVR